MGRSKGTCPTCQRFDVGLIVSGRPGHVPIPKLANHARPEGGRCSGSYTAPAPERPKPEPWQACAACRLDSSTLDHTCGR